MKNNVLCIILLISICRIGQTQTDTLLLPTAEVVGNSIRSQAIGQNTLEWSSEDLKTLSAVTLGELLQTETNIYLKSYGLKNLSTSSIRGGSAGHTLVLWNGLPIQSPMLGLLDLSLLPVHNAESIVFQKGGASTLWGNGAIGGVIAMNNTPDSSKVLALNSQIQGGAFGDFLINKSLNISTRYFQSRTKISFYRANNEFEYTLRDDLPPFKLSNAEVRLFNFQQDLHFFIRKNQTLSLHYWRQKSYREIPPLITESFSEAYQKDEANRILANWQANGARYNFKIRSGYFHEKLRYVNPVILLDAPSQFYSWLSDMEVQLSVSAKQKLNFGLGTTFTKAEADGYQEGVRENRISYFANYLLDLSRFKLQTGLRHELFNGTSTPLIPAIAIDYQLGTNWLIKGKTSRNYRLPTLNDRFWRPGGNPDLQAESGWSQELGLHYKRWTDHFGIDASLTAFNKNIENWILWAIRPGQPFWSAQNIAEVWSRGLEPRIGFTYTKNNTKIQLRLSYDYIRSTNQVELQSPNIQKGSQLLYTPKHQASSGLTIHFRQFQINYRHQFVGDTQGSNDPIEAFQVGNIRLSTQWERTLYNWQLYINLNNIWDTDYFIIERRPMPGRHLQAGIKMTIKSKSK